MAAGKRLRWWFAPRAWSWRSVALLVRLDAAFGMALGVALLGTPQLETLPSACPACAIVSWSASPKGLRIRNGEPGAQFRNRRGLVGGRRRRQIKGKAKAMAVPASHRELGNSLQGDGERARQAGARAAQMGHVGLLCPSGMSMKGMSMCRGTAGGRGSCWGSPEGFSSLPAESGPELRTPDVSAISPSLRNESLVSYASMSEEEEREGREVERGHGGAVGMQSGPEAPMSAEEDMKLSRQAMLIRRCSSQGSVTSLPEDPLNPVDAHSDWGHEGVSDLPPLGRGLDSSHPEEHAGGPGPEMGALPRVLMGPTWEKPTVEEEPPARSPLHGALTEESLPSSASPPGDAPAAPGPPRGLGCSRLREDRRESWRTNIHHLLDLEEQWDQLYHQELAMWQEERATQREERARDRELQFRLLGVLTDIRDELRYLRQERASARQSQAPPAEPRPDPSPLLEQPKAEPSFPEPQAGSASWGETAVPSRSPFGNRGRGRRRGRPRGSASRHRRLFLTNS